MGPLPTRMATIYSHTSPASRRRWWKCRWFVLDITSLHCTMECRPERLQKRLLTVASNGQRA